jgi:hypothetical protein
MLLFVMDQRRSLRLFLGFGITHPSCHIGICCKLSSIECLSCNLIVIWRSHIISCSNSRILLFKGEDIGDMLLGLLGNTG